jgi:hypothetical protein
LEGLFFRDTLPAVPPSLKIKDYRTEEQILETPAKVAGCTSDDHVRLEEIVQRASCRTRGSIFVKRATFFAFVNILMVMTTSADERDINAAYDRNANCYITKPVDLCGFIEVMQSLSRFTLTWVALPTND